MTDPPIRIPSEFKSRETQRWGRDLQSHRDQTSAHGAAGNLFGTGDITGDPVGAEDFATETAGGVVLKAAASANAGASGVSVDSADISGSADLTYDFVERDMLNALLTLANELKADVNTLVTNHNSLKDSLNDLKAKERTAGQLAT